MFFHTPKFFITAAVAAASVLLAAAELSFDNEIKALKSWQKKMISIDSKVTLGGKPTIRLENKGILGKTLDLDPNARYELSYYVKGKDVEPGPGKGALVMFNGGKAWGRAYANDGNVPDSGTFDWRKGSGIIDCKKFGTGKIRILPAIRGKGVVWYSNLTLKKLAAAPKDTNNVSFNADWFPANMDGGKYSFCENLMGQLELVTKGKSKYNAKSAELVIMVPEFMDLLSVCETLSLSFNKFRRIPAPFTASKVRRDGIVYNSYKVTLNSSFVWWINQAWYRHIAYFKAAPGSVGKSGKLYWTLRIGSELQKERSITVKVIDKVKFPEKPCKEFAVWINTLQGAFVPVPGMRESTQKFWASLSENRYTIFKNRDKGIPFPGYKFIVGTGGNNFQHNVADKELKEMLKHMPQDVTDTGIVGRRNSASLWALVDDEKGIYEKYMRTMLRKLKQHYGTISHIWWDFEPHPFGYDDGGRKRFAKKIGLKHVPSREEIVKKYPNQYFNYMVKLHSELIAKNARFIREELPGAKFWLCSDNLHADNPHVARWCGVDVSLSDNVVDIHNHMPYYAGLRFFNDVEFNISKLKKPFFPLIDPAERLTSFYTQYSASKVMQNIVASAALGSVGIGFWPDDLMQGEYYHGIAEGFSKVSAGEAFYFKGTRCDKDFKVRPRNVVARQLPGGQEITFPDFSKTLRYTVHKLNGKYLATVFNYDPEKTLIAEVSGKGIKPFLVKVPPQGCTLAGSDIMQPQAALRSEIARFAGSGDVFKDHVKGNIKVSWVSSSTGTPLLELSNGIISAGVDACGKCDVASLRHKEGSEMLTRGFAGRVMFENTLYSELPFKRTKHGIDASNRPFAEVEAVIPAYTGGAASVPHPLYGLELRRHMTLDGNKLVITHFFHNKAKKDIAIKGRLNNYPWLGYRFKANQVRMGKYDSSSPINVWLRKPQWSEGDMLLTADNGTLKESILFTPEKNKFNGIYMCTLKSGMPRKTVEFIVDRTLKPGEKWSCSYAVIPVK